MAIIKNHRLEYEVGQIDVTYPKNDKETYFGSVPVIVPNNWTPPKPPPQPGKMPVKGDLISIDEKQYRVLKIDDTIAEVLAMYTATTDQTFNDEENNIYANSSLDTYLSQTFYNSLSTTMQNAIVVKTFQQDSWKTGYQEFKGTDVDGDQYGLTLDSTTYGDSISKKCYVLSIQDIIDYLEVTTTMTSADTTLTSENISKMFWNQTVSPNNGKIWLRSAYAQGSTDVYCVNWARDKIDSFSTFIVGAVRPAFQIDLSKIDFEEV